ncbi:ferric siderophore receptor [Azorhizobium oxalatiphilum]|uniref:Ferric siderophore receptor n=1 Tax=Azorhizobium oxalatiphilum TaxID=980631 RepID=A0A917BX73_9HYPH|nr:TonB-dependent siderophore receptor [Azorhizobium oxalatiphilum]GGF58303.1 ferric siderophore receptor [Azorhizobium oxalatiphilum]
MAGTGVRDTGKAPALSGWARWLCASTALCLAGPLVPAPALAQSAVAARTQALSLSIPAQPLPNAIDAFIRATGWQVGYSSNLVEGLRSRPVSGSYAPLDALTAMLAGTGIRVNLTGPVTATLIAPTAVRNGEGAGGILLDTVTVTGTQNPTAHVDGYLATSSATASKMAVPIIETPQSISVVTSDLIRDTNSTTITEAIQYTPGVIAQAPAFSRMVDDLTIRGFNVANGNTGMLRDGLKYQSNVYDGGQEPYGLERIEILRGPSSILYGQLSPGGVVNAVSKRPTFTPVNEVNLEIGSYDKRQLSADLSGPVAGSSNMAYRLTALVREADTSVDYVNDDRIYVAPAFTWKNEDTSLTILANYQRIDTKFAAPIPYSAVKDYGLPQKLFIGNANYDTYISDTYSAGYIFDHEFDNGIKLHNTMRYYQADVTWDYMQWGGLLGNGTLVRRASDREETSTGIAADTNLEMKFQTGPVAHTVLAGFDYYYRTYDSDRFRSGLDYTFNIRTPNNLTALPTINYGANFGSDSTGEQFGVYLQDQIKIYDKFVVLLGGRYDWSNSETLAYSTRRTTTQDDAAFSGRAGLVYLFDNGLAPYVSVSQSFAPQVGADAITGDAFKPTEGLGYEGGLRYEPPGSNILLSGAVYDITQSNVLTLDASGNQYQIGEVRSRGFEFEAHAKYGQLNLVASYAYTDARITDSIDPTEIGQREALVPYNAVGLWADYGLDDWGLRGMRVGAGVRYLSDMNMPDVGQTVPGYTLVDAMIRYDLESFNPNLKGAILAVNAKNLFGEEYLVCVASDGCRYGSPRTVSATLTYRW